MTSIHQYISVALESHLKTLDVASDVRFLSMSGTLDDDSAPETNDYQEKIIRAIDRHNSWWWMSGTFKAMDDDMLVKMWKSIADDFFFDDNAPKRFFTLIVKLYDAYLIEFNKLHPEWKEDDDLC